MDKTRIYIVATPIGNLDDVTYRAIKILKTVDIIACEDTRITSKLLTKYKIFYKKLFLYHDKNEKQAALKLIELAKTKKIAIVCDAGMPVIADPGFEIIKQARLQKIKLTVIPGVSAQLMVAAISGLSPFYTFLGFLSHKTTQRQKQFKSLTPGTYISYVSPYKLINTLLDLKTIFGTKIRIFLAKELTKKFETYFFGTITSVLEQLPTKIKGEYTLAFEVITPNHVKST